MASRAAAAHASRVKVRRYIVTGGVATTVFLGSIYGAGLKIQGEAKTVSLIFFLFDFYMPKNFFNACLVQSPSADEAKMK